MLKPIIFQNDICDYYYIRHPPQIQYLIQQLDSNPICALDTETMAHFEQYGDRAEAVDPHTSQVRLLQVNWKGALAPFLVDILKLGIEETYPLLQKLAECSKVFFNAKFDIKMIKKTWGDYWDEETWDAFLDSTYCARVGMLLVGQGVGFKAARTRGYRYSTLCRDFFGVQVDKTEQNSHWGTKTLTEEQLIYAAVDVGAHKDSGHYSYLLEAWEILKETACNPLPEGFNEEFLWDCEQDKMRLVADHLEWYGLPINTALLKQFLDHNRRELERYKVKVFRYLSICPSRKSIIDYENGLVIGFEDFIPDDQAKLLNSPAALCKKINQLLKPTGVCLTNAQSETLESELKNLKVQKEETDNQEKMESQLLTLEETLDSTFLQREESIFTGIELIEDILAYKKLCKLVDKDWFRLINIVTQRVHASYGEIGTATGRMSSSGKILGVRFNCQQINKEHAALEVSTNDLILCESRETIDI